MKGANSNFASLRVRLRARHPKLRFRQRSRYSACVTAQTAEVKDAGNPPPVPYFSPLVPIPYPKVGFDCREVHCYTTEEMLSGRSGAGQQHLLGLVTIFEIDLQGVAVHRNDLTDTLAHDGVQTLVAVIREPDSSLGVHTHVFEAKALVLKGALSITVAGVERKYRSGQVFHSPALLLHSARYVPQGVEVLVGRKCATLYFCKSLPKEFNEKVCHRL